ncbi:hypothetical protein QE152_g37363 [Popillia japonica]|uniref:Uncharacterized protein n=1 Tax=Popillia japonica TaxID=7064 RepID=A0AAW1IAM6_POPJA
MVPLMDGTLDEGNIDFARTLTETCATRSGKKGTSSKTSYVLPYSMNIDGINDTRKLYELINNLDMLAETHGIKKLQLASLGYIDGIKKLQLASLGYIDINYLEKCAEYITRGTDRTIEILVTEPRDNEKRNPRARKLTLRKKQVEPVDKIIIKAEGKDYAEILRTIKSQVKPEEIGAQVKSIKKTSRGDVLLPK